MQEVDQRHDETLTVQQLKATVSTLAAEMKTLATIYGEQMRLMMDQLQAQREMQRSNNDQVMMILEANKQKTEEDTAMREAQMEVLTQVASLTSQLETITTAHINLLDQYNQVLSEQ